LCPKVSATYKKQIKDSIIQSAIENFAKTGFDRTKMDIIAQSCGLSKGTIYLYYKSKEELFYSICELNLEILKDNLFQLFASKQDLLNGARQFYDTFQKDYKSVDRVRLEMIAESSRSSKLRKILLEYRSKTHFVVATFLKSQIQKGLVAPDIDIDSVTIGLVALYDGLIINKIIGMKGHQISKTWVEMINIIFLGITK
jgi:AcrR family transcriptional regulator